MSDLADIDGRATPLEALLARTARAPETTALVANGEAWSQARLEQVAIGWNHLIA